MIKQIGILFLMLICLNCNSQSDQNNRSVELKSNEVYLVNVEIDTIFLGWQFKELGRKYKICRIVVNKIYYMADTISVTKSQLLHAKYMLFNANNILNHQIFDVSLVASDKRDVFIMSGLLNEEKIHARKYFHHAIITSIGIKCRKINKFLKLHLN